MRVCVFVDGENMRFTICDLFDKFDRDDYLPKTADWTKFFDDVVSQAEPTGRRLRTYWYVVQNLDAYPRPLGLQKRTPAELDAWAKSNAKVLAPLYTIPATEPERSKILTEIQEDLARRLTQMKNRFDGWTTLQNGIAKKHRAVEFRRSGAISYNLTNRRLGEEKTVDVNLGVDMVTSSDIYDVAVIVSGDQDYVPAAQAVKNLGKSVVNVAFLTRGGVLLPGGAQRLNQITDWSISVEWDVFRTVLGIAK